MKRVLMGALIATIFVAVIIAGEFYDRFIMSIFMYIVIGICVLEIRYAFGDKIDKRYNVLIWIYALGFGIPYFYFGFIGIVLFTLGIFICCAIVTILDEGKFDSLITIAFILIYPALLLSSLLYINKCASTKVIDSTAEVYPYLSTSILGEQLLPYHTVGLALVFAVSCFTDASALIFGKLFGKHKLCPTLSPNKTVEGAIGGIIGGVVAASLVFYLFEVLTVFKTGLPVKMSLKILNYSLIGVLGSVCTQLGDLIASMVKRSCNIKDFSHLLGSHGGFMDRFDGIMLNGCFVALIYLFIL